MKAIIFEDQNVVALKNVPDPRPTAGEVLIEIQASGICHTDMEVLRGNYGISAFPLVTG